MNHRNTLVSTLDVREDLRRKEQPFDKIIQAVHALKIGEQLLLITPFEPSPLFSVIKAPTFSIHSLEIAADHWENTIKREADDSTLLSPSFQAQKLNLMSPRCELDLRELEPPEPLVKALRALESEQPGTLIVVTTERRPIHLLDALENRGAAHETEEQPDGSWVTYFQRI